MVVTAVIVTVVAIGPKGTLPECEDNRCPLRTKCANHSSAGEFRMEDGLTPELKLIGNNWECSQKSISNHGAIFTDGTTMQQYLYKLNREV